MSQRNALMLATALTAFVLVLVGGVAAGIAQPWTASAAAPAVSSTDPTVQALLARDAQYRQLLEQANQRLAQAYAQQQPAAQAVPQAAPETPAYPVSSDLAASIAQQAAPGARLVRGAELVSFQGAVAYEVLLDRGTVYVDATSGAVLFNGAAQIAGVPPVFDGEHEDHDEHEGGEDH